MSTDDDGLGRSTARRVVASPWFHVASGVGMAALVGFFAVAHVRGYAETGNASLLVFCAVEIATAVFFVVRTQPRSFATRPVEWFVAAGASFVVYLFRPTGVELVPGARFGVIAGAVLQLLGVISLNRSFAVVPALREVKTAGMYRFVRHPIYASYAVTFASYVAANFSWLNLAVWAVQLALMLLRLQYEEAHLSNDPAYRLYRERVRWRLVPGVF